MGQDWSALGSVVRPAGLRPASDWSSLGEVVTRAASAQPAQPVRHPARYETDQGTAFVSARPDGSEWLQTSSGFSGPLGRFTNARPIYQNGPTQTGDGSTARAYQPHRTLADRLRSTASDNIRTGVSQAAGRAAMARQGNQTLTDPRTGERVELQSVGSQMVADERRRRENYDNTLTGDRWYQAPINAPGAAIATVTGGDPVLTSRLLAGGATLLGAFGGAVADPTNLVGGGGRTLAAKVAGEAGVNAGTDAVAQWLDLVSGTRDRYDPTETVAAGGLGGLIGGGMHVAPHAGRALSDWSSLGQVITRNPVPAFDGPAMDAGVARDASGPHMRGGADLPVQPPFTARAAGAPAALVPHMERAAQATGVSSGYLADLARRESAFRPNADAGTSSARGLYQFTDQTWLNTLRRHGAAMGLPDIEARIARDPAAVLAMRDDPAVSSLAAGYLTADNRASLARRLGRQPTDAELYQAHFLGDAGAARLASADPRARAADLFGDAADANRRIFFDGDRARSVGEVRAALAEGFGGGSAARPLADPESFGPLYREPSSLVASTFDRPDLTPEQLGINTPADRSAAAPSLAEPMRSSLLDAELARLRETPDRAPAATERGITDAGYLPAEVTGRRGERLGMMASEAPAFHARNTPAASSEVAVARRADDWSRLGDVVQRGNGRDWSSLGQVVAPAGDKLAVDLSGYRDRIGQSSPQPTTGKNGMRAAPEQPAIARGAGEAFGGKTVSDLAADLRSALGLTHRQGRVGARNALGTYDTGSGVVRTKAVDELDVLAHEATHALEYEIAGPNLQAAMKKHAKELKALDYEPDKARRHEGFAEFGRWYLSNPDHARRVAPAFYDDFEAAMAKDAPEALAGMKAVQEGYQNHLKSASIDVAKASLAYTGNKGPIGNLMDEVRRKGPGSVVRRAMDSLYTALVDDLHPIHIAERELAKLYLANNGKKLEMKRAASPYAISRLTREAYAAGHNDLMNGVTPYHGLDPEGPGLADALETAGIEKISAQDLKDPRTAFQQGHYKPDALREFDVYLIARRAIHLWDRYAAGDLPNPPDRNNRVYHEQVIADAEAAHPEWDKAAGQVYDFLGNLWRKKYEGGLITRESYENGLTHVDYVPFNRDMSDKGVGRGGKPRGALQYSGGVHALEGSSRDIVSPLSSIMREAYSLNAILRRNDAMKALDDLAQAAGRGAGAIVERLPAHEVEAINISAAHALEQTAKEMGVTGRDLSTLQQLADDATADKVNVTLFKQSEFSPRKGEAVVFVWRDGKKQPLLLADGEFGQSLYSSLTGMNKEMRNVVVDAMAAATGLLRYGVTLSPEFMGANILRDAVATWINTDVGFVPLVDTVRGGALELRQGETAKRYANAGGMRGGANTAATAKPFPQTDRAAEAQLQHLRVGGHPVMRYASWRGLSELADLSETSTRMAVFKRAFDKAKREGLSDYEALIESGFTSRDYLDFGRRGSKMVTAARVVTFLNAAIQGLDKTGRVLSAGGNLKALLTPLSREARTPAEKAALAHAYKAWGKVAAIGAFGLALRMLYADDPEYQEIGDRLRATNWVFKVGGKWVFVPKPFELATLSNIFERAYEGTVLNDPTAGERLLSDFRNTIAPPSEVPALSIPFDIARNRDHLGRPIVPDHLRGSVDPEQQFNGYTSDLGKLIGKTFKVSPAVVDYLFTGYGGSLGRYVLQGSNLAGEAITGRPRTAAGPEDMFLARRFVRDISRGSTSQGEFWDEVSRDGGRMTRAEGTFRARMAEGDAQAAQYLNGLAPDQRAYVVAKVFSPDGESAFHPLIRVQKVVSVLSDFRTAVRGGDLRDQSGAVIPLTPGQRHTIDAALADMGQAEMRNALIEAGVRGWQQKQPMDVMAIAERIGRTSPDTARQLQSWLGQAKAATVFHPQQLAASQAAWQARAAAFAAPVDPAFLAQRMAVERLHEGNRLGRYQEALRYRGSAPELMIPRQPATPPPAPRVGLLGGVQPRRGLLQ